MISPVRGAITLKRTQTILWAFLALAICPVLVPAQEKRLSPKAQKLTEAWAELQRAPNDPIVQGRYLDIFPHDYKSFQDLFDLDRELYSGYDFINVLPSLAKNHETEVGKLLVQLSKDAHYEADAPSYLQHATATYGSQYSKTFVGLLNLLSADKQAHLIAFLADVENHASYKEYQHIIDHLKALGEDGFAKKFEAAREKRTRQHHDPR